MPVGLTRQIWAAPTACGLILRGRRAGGRRLSAYRGGAAQSGIILAGLWQLTAFVDSGHVSLYESPSTATDNNRTLSGAGIGLNVAAGREWTVKANLAWRLTAASPVSDSDRAPRPWLQAVMFF